MFLKSHFKWRKKHKKSISILQNNLEEIYFLEVLINRIADLLHEQIEQTKQRVETKQGRTLEEIQQELEEPQDFELEDDEEEKE